MDFDPRKVKSALPGSIMLFESYPGLRLHVSETRRSWIYRYKSPKTGGMRQIRIGAWPALSFGEAVSKWNAYRSLRDAGEDPAQIKQDARSDAKRGSSEVIAVTTKKMTFREICDTYLELHVKPNRSFKSYEYVEYIFNAHLGSMANLPIDDLCLATAYEHIEKIAETHGAPVVAKNLRLELAAATSYVRERGLVPQDTPNWWYEIKFGQSLRKKLKSKGKKISGVHVGRERRVLKEHELSVLIPWLPNFSQAVNDALVLYLWTGVRGAEIVRIEGKEVCEEQDGILWWNCPKHKTKNARREFATDLRVPLFGRAREVILRRKERFGESWLWPSDRSKKIPYMEQESIGNRVREHQPRNAANNNYPVLPVVDWTPHDLRRTARTLLASLSCPKDVAEQVLGHMPEGISGVYDRHTYDAERKYWLNRLADHLESISRR